MKRIILVVIVGMMGYFCFAADDAVDVSIQDYLDYLQTLQNISEKATENNSFNMQRVFGFGRIEEQIHSFFNPQNMNTWRWQEAIRKNEHASLIVFFLTLGGLIMLLYGYKIFPFLLLVFGAFFGAVTTYNVINHFLKVSENQLVLFLILGGVVTAIAVLLIKKIFVFLLGAFVGLFGCQFLFSLFSLPIENTLLLMVFIAGLFAVFALLLGRLFIFFFTSFCSSWMCVFGAQYVILEIFQNMTYQNQFLSYTSIVLFLILLITGFYLQYKTNSP